MLTLLLLLIVKKQYGFCLEQIQTIKKNRKSNTIG